MAETSYDNALVLTGHKEHELDSIALASTNNENELVEKLYRDLAQRDVRITNLEIMNEHYQNKWICMNEIEIEMKTATDKLTTELGLLKQDNHLLAEQLESISKFEQRKVDLTMEDLRGKLLVASNAEIKRLQEELDNEHRQHNEKFEYINTLNCEYQAQINALNKEVDDLSGQLATRAVLFQSKNRDFYTQNMNHIEKLSIQEKEIIKLNGQLEQLTLQYNNTIIENKELTYLLHEIKILKNNLQLQFDEEILKSKEKNEEFYEILTQRDTLQSIVDTLKTQDYEEIQSSFIIQINNINKKNYEEKEIIQHNINELQNQLVHSVEESNRWKDEVEQLRIELNMKSSALEEYAQNRLINHRQWDHRQESIQLEHTQNNRQEVNILHTTTAAHSNSNNSHNNVNMLHSDHQEHDEISQVTIEDHSIHNRQSVEHRQSLEEEEVLRSSLSLEHTQLAPSATTPLPAPTTVTPSPIRPVGRYDRSAKQQSGLAGDLLRGSVDTLGSVESEGDSWLHSFIANGGDHPVSQPQSQPEEEEAEQDSHQPSELRQYTGIATSTTPPLPSHTLTQSHSQQQQQQVLAQTVPQEFIYEGLVFSEINQTVLNTWDLFTTSLQQAPLPNNLSGYLLNELLSKLILKLPTVDHINTMFVSLDRMITTLKQQLNRQLHLQASTSTSSSTSSNDNGHSHMLEEKVNKELYSKQRKHEKHTPNTTSSLQSNPFSEQCGYCQRRNIRENHIITTERKLASERLEQAIIGMRLENQQLLEQVESFRSEVRLYEELAERNLEIGRYRACEEYDLRIAGLLEEIDCLTQKLEEMKKIEEVQVVNEEVQVVNEGVQVVNEGVQVVNEEVQKEEEGVVLRGTDAAVQERDTQRPAVLVEISTQTTVEGGTTSATAIESSGSGTTTVAASIAENTFPIQLDEHPASTAQTQAETVPISTQEDTTQTETVRISSLEDTTQTETVPISTQEDTIQTEKIPFPALEDLPAEETTTVAQTGAPTTTLETETLEQLIHTTTEPTSGNAESDTNNTTVLLLLQEELATVKSSHAVLLQELEQLRKKLSESEAAATEFDELMCITTTGTTPHTTSTVAATTGTTGIVDEQMNRTIESLRMGLHDCNMKLELTTTELLQARAVIASNPSTPHPTTTTATITSEPFTLLDTSTTIINTTDDKNTDTEIYMERLKTEIISLQQKNNSNEKIFMAQKKEFMELQTLLQENENNLLYTKQLLFNKNKQLVEIEGLNKQLMNINTLLEKKLIATDVQCTSQDQVIIELRNDISGMEQHYKQVVEQLQTSYQHKTVENIAIQTDTVPAEDAHQSTTVPAEDAHQSTTVPAEDAHQSTTVPAEDAHQFTTVPAEDAHQSTTVPAGDAHQPSAAPYVLQGEFNSMVASLQLQMEAVKHVSALVMECMKDKSESTDPNSTALHLDNLRTELDHKIILVNKQIETILTKENNLRSEQHIILYENNKNKERIQELESVNKVLLEQNMSLLNNNIYLHTTATTTSTNNNPASIRDDNSINIDKQNYEDIIVQLSSQITKVEELKLQIHHYEERMQDFKSAFREQRSNYHAKLKRQQARYDDEKAAIVTWVKDECAQIGVEFFQLLQRNKEALRKQQQGEDDEVHAATTTPRSAQAATTASTQQSRGGGVNTTATASQHDQQPHYHHHQQQQQQHSSSSRRRSRSSKSHSSPAMPQQPLPEEAVEGEQRTSAGQQGYSAAYEELLRSSTNSLPHTHSARPPRSERKKHSSQSPQKHHSQSTERHSQHHHNNSRDVSPEIHVRFTPTVPPSPPVPRNLSVYNNPIHAAAVLAAHTLPSAQVKSLLRNSMNTQQSAAVGETTTATTAVAQTEYKASEPLQSSSNTLSPKPSYANPTVAYTAQRRSQHPGYDTQGAIHPPSSSHDIAGTRSSHTRTQHRTSSAPTRSSDVDSSRSPPRRRTTTATTTSTNLQEGRTVHEPHQSLTPSRDKTHKTKNLPPSTSILNNSSTEGLSAVALHSSQEKELWRSLQDEEYQEFIKYQQYQREVNKRSFRNI